MRKTCGREEWQLLPTNDGVHCVDCTDPGLDHLLWVDARLWVQRGTINVQKFFCQHDGTFINRLSRAIESTTHEVVGDGHFQRVASELNMAILVINVAGAFEHLNDGLFLVDLENLSLTYRAVRKIDVHD